MIVVNTVERLTPTSSSGYGVKVSFIYTSFDEKEIDFIEEQARKITNTVVEVKADGVSD
jgi:hypothetical protein